MNKQRHFILFFLVALSTCLIAGLLFFPFYPKFSGKTYPKLKLELNTPKREGRWRRARTKQDLQANDSNKDKLLALPYLQGYHEAPKDTGIVVHDEKRAFDGLNFVVSAHKPSAFIMDMKGNILHEWSLDFEKVLPNKPDFRHEESHKIFWRRAHLFPNGDLLIIFEGIVIAKIDKHSNLIWANPCAAHHDIFVDDNGNIYTLTRREVQDYKRKKFEGPILEDFITILDSKGKIVRNVSLLECVLNTKAKDETFFTLKKGDIFHTNTIEVLDGSVAHINPLFKKGRVLVSFRENHTIAVVDLNKKKVVWQMHGPWSYQHQPTVLADGNIIVFDNNSKGSESRIIEVDSVAKKVVWVYEGKQGEEFFSKECCGSNQRLPNGNTLITETDYGRAFEVTPDGKIVWEFLNPHRSGPNKELIASILEVIRIPPGSIPCSSELKGRCFTSPE